MSLGNEQLRDAYLENNVPKMRRLHNKAAIRARFGDRTSKPVFILPEIILGGQDGLVNVLGVILGVAAATSSTPIVIVAGLAAVFAESISMAAVAYTSKLAEADFYESEYEREKWEIEQDPKAEREEVRELYKTYGFEGEILEQIVNKISANKDLWLRVMMEQELKIEPIYRKDALPAAFVVGVATTVGSFVPLLPFIFLPIYIATPTAVSISAIALFIVGFYKAKTTLGRNLLRQGLEMMVIGMSAAFIGYFIGTIFKVPAV